MEAKPNEEQSVEVKEVVNSTPAEDWDSDVAEIPRLQVIDEHQKFT